MKKMIDNKLINDILLETADSLCIRKKQEIEIKKAYRELGAFFRHLLRSQNMSECEQLASKIFALN